MVLLGLSTIVRYSFDEDEGGWIAGGKGGAVRIARGAADVKNGAGALALDYTVGDGVAVAVLPLRGVATARIDSVRFWMKTDVPTGVVVTIAERKPGGRYNAICWSTGNQWQRVELRVQDFSLAERPADGPDEPLDMGAVETIGVLDMSSLTGVRVDPNAAYVAESHAGPHSLFLDDFELASGGERGQDGPATIDDFAPPQLRWFTPGGVELKPEGRGLRAIYRQMDERSIVLRRPLGKVDLRGKEFLEFDVASEGHAFLTMSFEGKDGGRFNANVEVDGGGRMEHREVLFSAFENDEGKVQWDRLKSFSIIDVTGTITGQSARNSLWIGNIRGADEKAGPRR